MNRFGPNNKTSILPIAVFLLTLAAGFLAWMSVYPMILPQSVSNPFHDREALLRGRVAATVDRSVEEEHPFREPALSLITALRLLLFREGSGPVVVGEDYRLYTREEFEYHPGDEETLALRANWIRRAARILREDGVPLVLVLLPSKARVASLDAHPRLDLAKRILREDVAALVSPLSALEERDDAFLRTDTHWSWSGAFKTAGLVAQSYREVYGKPLSAGTTYVLKEEQHRVHHGDLLRFLPLGRWQQFFPLEPDLVTVPAVAEQADAASDTGAGLFDVPEIPVALVGTSYSAGEVWNFVGALQYTLQADVLSVAEEGLGPFEPMYRYLTGPTYREIQPSLVVWEIPERYLTLPDTALPDLPENLTVQAAIGIFSNNH